MILTLDPGIRGCGVALFAPGRELQWASYVRNPIKKGAGLDAITAMGCAVVRSVPLYLLSRFVGEWPQIYRVGMGKGDPNDLPPLAGVVSAVAALLPDAVSLAVSPRQWKGTIDGDAMTRRILGLLTPEEVARAQPCAASLAHNMWDAVGIGLWAVGRLQTRLYPRA